MKSVIGLVNPFGLIQKAGMRRSTATERLGRKKIYRSRVKYSKCRSQLTAACKAKYGCKKTRHGRRRSYCRKTRNRHI
jgi:hypothetical protein